MRAGYLTALGVALTMAIPAPGRAQPDSNSANWVMPACQAYLQDRLREDLAFEAGVCNGGISGILVALVNTRNICPPSNISRRQLNSVVIRYIESRPERWHENFNLLVIEALRATWPCRR